MKLTGLFKRGAACLCTAAILMGGVSAFALSPALPDEPAPGRAFCDQCGVGGTAALCPVQAHCHL